MLFAWVTRFFTRCGPQTGCVSHAGFSLCSCALTKCTQAASVSTDTLVANLNVASPPGRIKPLFYFEINPPLPRLMLDWAREAEGLLQGLCGPILCSALGSRVQP